MAKRMSRVVETSEGWTNTYGLEFLPAQVKVGMGGKIRADYKDDPSAWWSGKGVPPKVGTRVRVAINAIGWGKVVGYFVEYGWLGVEVDELEAPPAWYVKQNGNKSALVFGAELAKEELAQEAR